MFILKVSTAKDIKLGPFVDKGDGVAYETGMAAAMDHADTGVRLSKNGAAFADRHEGTEPSYDAFGYYLVKLDTTDTDTVGTLKVIFGDAAVCLPCEANFQVVNANVYDSLFAAATTDYLQVDALQLGGATQSASDLKDFADTGYDPTTHKVAGVVTTDTCTTNTDLVSAATIADAVWDEAAAGHTDAGKAGAQVWTDIDAILADTNELQTDDIPGALAALENISAAEVNAEVVDALATDTIAEMSQGAPPAAPTLVAAINYLYRYLVRNKVKVDATSAICYADDKSTALFKSALSDDATDFIRDEMITGA